MLRYIGTNRRLQFTLRSLLALVTVAGVIGAISRWWDSTRDQRSLVRLIREYGDEESKALLCSLVWQDDAEPLLAQLRIGLRPDEFVGTIVTWHHLEWSGEYADSRGQERKVFVFSDRGYVKTIVVTDPGNQLLTWTDAKCGRMLRSATLTNKGGKPKLSLVTFLPGFQPTVGAVQIYQYELADANVGIQQPDLQMEYLNAMAQVRPGIMNERREHPVPQRVE